MPINSRAVCAISLDSFLLKKREFLEMYVGSAIFSATVKFGNSEKS